MAQRLVTDRLMLRTWHLDDAQAALDVFGHLEVARWLSPIMGQVPDLPAMQLLLQQWIVEDARAIAPAGRWCIQRLEDQREIGGAILLLLPPGNQDLERSEEHTSELQSPYDLVCRLLLEKKKKHKRIQHPR